MAEAGFEDGLEPCNERERAVAGRAIFIERERRDGDKLVEALTERERLLIEDAWSSGAYFARDTIAKELANPHAVTLDAVKVAEVLSRHVAGPEVDNPMWDEQDPRVVDVVRRVVKLLKARRQVPG